ncbi:PREDICTED: thioredoxin domain-containing protein 6 [Propithecus coquereli]|uniref:thioredoxin domain-containing protein 6 n=1 Tax=Propithecus coquereli TaxID=379532 RepID=UPI00063FB494|nr:PREDICTED: thioredoxin domain-containing protein 6 [Propithecus coquereli]
MGSKKKEVALQVNISTQELWEEMLSTKGLTVVDVYQGWCGPCKPVVSLFQKMRIEVGLDLLHFASAEADRLDVLEKYRGKCEPTFLFYAGGELVAVVRGANAPLLQKTILDQLEAEKKVLAEGRERKVIKDEALSDEDGCFSHGKDIGEDEDLVSSEKACTVAIIKPDAVAHGKTDEIIMKVRETLTLHDCPHVLCGGQQGGTLGSGILVLKEDFEGVKFLNEDYMEPEVDVWTLGVVLYTMTARTLPFDGENWGDQFSGGNMIHGSVPSLHAQYGTEMPFNAVHESRDREAAHRELALLFPNSKFSDKDIEAPTGGEAEGAAGPTEALGIPEDVD